jgi:hypothetical protein
MDGEIVAALSFVEGTGAGKWGVSDLRLWLDEHLVEPGRMARPSSVREPPAGTSPLSSSRPWEMSSEEMDSVAALPEILALARRRVVSTIEGFLSVRGDDRFLIRAIREGQVVRRRTGKEGAWVLRASTNAMLSDIVLGLFAVEILSDRERMEQSLCVCEDCGRIWVEEDARSRRACYEHPPRPSWIPTPLPTLPSSGR